MGRKRRRALTVPRQEVGKGEPNDRHTVERLILAEATGTYGERTPRGELQQYASHLWRHTTGDTGEQRVTYPPDGFPDVIVFQGTPWIYGPCVGPTIETVPSNFSVVGVALKPGVIPRWTGVSLSELLNVRIPLADVLPKLAERIMNEVGDCTDGNEIGKRLENVVRSDMHRVNAPDAAHAHIRRALDQRTTTSATTSQIARALGTSERTLRRHCDNLFGYGPKTLERVLRLQRFLKRARASSNTTLSALAYDAGFSDQAHLSREIRSLTGLTPQVVLKQVCRPLDAVRHERGAERNEDE